MAQTQGQSSKGRILALDVGKKRIGLAISDELGFAALGLETLHRTRIRKDLEKFSQIVADYHVGTLLVGHPLHMSGDESRQGQFTKEFAERLRAHVGLPVIFWDERLTSAEAERLMREAGAGLERRKKAIDQMAAILLLESYMGYLNGLDSDEGCIRID